MGLFDFLFRRDQEVAEVDLPEPAMGSDSANSFDPSHEFEQGVGGKHFFSAELTRLRYATTAEAVNTARSNPDPANWQDGQLQFEMERSTAHDHEALRDQLSNAVAARLAVEAGEVYSSAFDVGVAREHLRSTDEKLARVTSDWRQKYRLAERDPMEIGRFYRLQPGLHKAIKLSILIVFIIAELILTANVFAKIFEGRFDLPPELVGTVLALGVILLLIVVPHYAAIGIKEGLTSFHSFERSDYERREQSVPFELRQMEHREKQEDRVFRWAAAAMSALLLAAIFPLSWLRAADLENDLAPTWMWFVLFVAVQTAISTYFFFREWLDYGPFSKDLYENYKDLEPLRTARDIAIAAVADSGEEFHLRAEDLLFTLQEAPRWDNFIVETYLGTIHFARHIVGLANPEIRPFIAGAVVPYLGTRAEAAESDYALEALSLENASLESDRPSGRKWRIKRVGEEWDADFEDPDQEDTSKENVAWMLTKTPLEMLEEILDRHFDLPAKYVRPSILDGPHADPDEEGWMPAELPVADPSGSGATRTAAEPDGNVVDNQLDESLGDVVDTSSSEPATPVAVGDLPTITPSAEATQTRSAGDH